jgi:hypothetical protein
MALSNTSKIKKIKKSEKVKVLRNSLDPLEVARTNQPANPRKDVRQIVSQHKPALISRTIERVFEKIALLASLVGKR